MIREVSGWQINSALFLIYYLYFMCVLGVCFLFSGQAVWLVRSQFPTQRSNMCSLHQGHGVLTTGPSGKFLTCAFCLQEIIKFLQITFLKVTLASPIAQWLRNLLAMQETQEMRVRSLGWEHPLEEEMATHSNVLAWKIPWTEEPCALHTDWLQRVRHV